MFLSIPSKPLASGPRAQGLAEQSCVGAATNGAVAGAARIAADVALTALCEAFALEDALLCGDRRA